MKEETMANKKRVFISFDVDHDKGTKDMDKSRITDTIKKVLDQLPFKT